MSFLFAFSAFSTSADVSRPTVELSWLNNPECPENSRFDQCLWYFGAQGLPLQLPWPLFAPPMRLALKLAPIVENVWTWVALTPWGQSPCCLLNVTWKSKHDSHEEVLNVKWWSFRCFCSVKLLNPVVKSALVCPLLQHHLWPWLLLLWCWWVMRTETDREGIWVAYLWNSIQLCCHMTANPRLTCSPLLTQHCDGSLPASGRWDHAGCLVEAYGLPASSWWDPSRPPCQLSWCWNSDLQGQK